MTKQIAGGGIPDALNFLDNLSNHQLKRQLDEALRILRFWQQTAQGPGPRAHVDFLQVVNGIIDARLHELDNKERN